MIGAGLLAGLAFAAGMLIGGDAGTSGPSDGATDVRAPFALEPLPGGLSEAQLAGQRLVAGFDGTEAPAGLKQLVKSGRIAGVVIFADNVGSKGGLREAIDELQSLPRPEGLEAPLAVMTDQEGGAVERIDGPPSASGAEMGREGTKFAARQGRATGRLLAKVGVNIDLAPVLDVGRSGSAIAQEGRSFGSNPGTVIGTAVNGFAAGLRSEAVAATAKHFPGFGAAEVNTDFASQEIDVSRSKLRRVDEAPFGAFVEDGGELVMLSNARYSAFGGEPAGLNRAIATRELRDRLGFGGVSVTDSLDAAAALEFGSRSEVALSAANAGSDILLYGDWETAREVGRTLAKNLGRGKLDREDFEASVQRVLSLRADLGG